jgi:hypothetical protein
LKNADIFVFFVASKLLMCYNISISEGDCFMTIVYQKDKRSGITYAYESTAYWDKEKKVSRSKRTLIGRVDAQTGEIVPTDGRNRKHSPYQRVEKTQRDEIMDRIRPMGISELRREVIRLEIELTMLKSKTVSSKGKGTV